MPRILSIDVGSQNLALCLYDSEGQTIIHWKVLSLQKPIDAHTVYETLCTELETWEMPQEMVIERQPIKSMVMCRIQYYCEMLGACLLQKPVKLMQPITKLNWASYSSWWPEDLVPSKKWSYRDRKAATVATVQRFLEDTHSGWKAMYEAAPKKDDLADALVQAMAFAQIHKLQTKETPENEEGNA